MNIINRISVILSTFFYMGYSPVAPGTVGTAGAVVLYLLVANNVDSFIYLLITLFLIVISILVSNISISHFGSNDPGEIVIDEVSGFLVTMLFIPFGVLNILFGFFLFRFFDIFKPYPVRKFEKLNGGYGVVLDDVAAGLYANIVLQIINYFKLV